MQVDKQYPSPPKITTLSSQRRLRPASMQALNKADLKIAAKKNIELWIYSFADMYMILSVFFITLSVLYAAKIKNAPPPSLPSLPKNFIRATGGQGPTSIQSLSKIAFKEGSLRLTKKAKDELSLFLSVIQATDPDQIVLVEGHIDTKEDLSIADRKFSSHLDLAQSRAVKVAEWLIENGVPSYRIQTFSYGSKFIEHHSPQVVIKITSKSNIGGQ